MHAHRAILASLGDAAQSHLSMMSPQQACYDARWHDIKSIIGRHHVSARVATKEAVIKESAREAKQMDKVEGESDANSVVPPIKVSDTAPAHHSDKKSTLSDPHSSAQQNQNAKLARPQSIVSMLSSSNTTEEEQMILEGEKQK